MKKCNKCNVYIREDANVCPLCKHGLEDIEDLVEENVIEYPNVVFSTKKFNILVRVFMLISIVLTGVLFLINKVTYSGTWWAVIVLGAIVYFWLILKYSILNNINFAMKILVPIMAAMLLVVMIDGVFGFSGWSVNYAVPSIAILGSTLIVILMVVNFMNWQSYILFQLAFVVFGVIFLILNYIGIITRPLMTYIAFGVAATIFLITIIFGDRKAKTELKRRFHI